jgi:hypothetical protein
MDGERGGTNHDGIGTEEDCKVEFKLFNDDSDLLGDIVVAHVLEKDSPIEVTLSAEGGLMSAAQAESLDDDIIEPSDLEPTAMDEPEELGVGKRKCKANTLYSSSIFWHHHDNQHPNSEHYI